MKNQQKANPNFLFLKEKVPKQRITLLQGGTRSGKTYSTIYYFIWLCQKYSGLEIDIVRDTFTALKATVWKDFKQVLIDCNLYNDKCHNKTDHIYYLNGNIINYYGADTPDKIHGRSRDILWINEAHQFDAEIVSQLFPRTKYKIICDYNPALGVDHWLDQYIDKYPPLITTYKDNPHLTTAQINDIESRIGDEYWWSVYGNGHRAVREGIIFKRWEVGEFDTTLPYCYGQDYGFSIDPTTLVKVAVNEKERLIYVHEVLYSKGKELGTHELAEANKNLIEKQTDLIVADNHGQQSRIIKDLALQGLNITGCTNETVASGITAMLDYKIVISESSLNIKKELSNYRWNDKKAGIPIDDNNHCIDAIRYAFRRLQRSKLIMS